MLPIEVLKKHQAAVTCRYQAEAISEHASQRLRELLAELYRGDVPECWLETCAARSVADGETLLELWCTRGPMPIEWALPYLSSQR